MHCSLSENLLTKDELFQGVLGAHNAPKVIMKQHMKKSDLKKSEKTQTTPLQSRVVATKSNNVFTSIINCIILSFNCSSNKKKHTKDKGSTCVGHTDSKPSTKSPVTYLWENTSREKESTLLYTKLMSSTRYKKYLKQCHNDLFQRLTCPDGKALVKKISHDEGKSVKKVVEMLVRELEAATIKAYIKKHEKENSIKRKRNSDSGPDIGADHAISSQRIIDSQRQCQSQ